MGRNWPTCPTDSPSGLSNAYAIPAGLGSEVTGLKPGTTNPVTVSYAASCCTSQVDIIGVDTVGNVGKCRIDMGVLGGKYRKITQLKWFSRLYKSEGSLFYILY